MISVIWVRVAWNIAGYWVGSVVSKVSGYCCIEAHPVHLELESGYRQHFTDTLSGIICNISGRGRVQYGGIFGH